MINVTPIDIAPDVAARLARAIETDRAYFEMGAEVSDLDGAILAWMPGLTRSPAAAVIHRVDPAAIAAGGEGWVSQAERKMADVGAALARIYLDQPHEGAEQVLRQAGFIDRDELVFTQT